MSDAEVKRLAEQKLQDPNVTEAGKEAIRWGDELWTAEPARFQWFWVASHHLQNAQGNTWIWIPVHTHSMAPERALDHACQLPA